MTCQSDCAVWKCMDRVRDRSTYKVCLDSRTARARFILNDTIWCELLVCLFVCLWVFALFLFCFFACCCWFLVVVVFRCCFLYCFVLFASFCLLFESPLLCVNKTTRIKLKTISCLCCNASINHELNYRIPPDLQSPNGRIAEWVTGARGIFGPSRGEPAARSTVWTTSAAGLWSRSAWDQHSPSV